MVCIYCGAKTEVTNSRLQKKTNRVWRRRLCTQCGAIFSSLEQVVYTRSLAVQYGASHIIPFDRDQLFLSIYEACRHRTSAVSDATALSDTVLGRLLPQAPDGLVDREDIVATVSTILGQFDAAARVQYLAFHPLRKG